jgi:hypothetical protein
VKRPAFLNFSTAGLVLACALLSACGGGLVAGVGSGGSGVAEGTLSGFGSVIVDGIEYSDTALSDVQRAALRLGQRVRLVYASDDSVVSIQVLPQLRGPVTASLDGSGWLRLAGQWVRVVASAEDASRSGITLVEGYGTNADGTAAAITIPAGQDAVAYGSWVWDASKAAYVLVATRIEKLAAPADPVLLGGVVVGAGAGGFRLGAADGTRVTAGRLPALVENAVVSLLVSRAGVVADSGAVAAVVAIDVQDASLGASDLSPYQSVRLGGLAGAVDAANAFVTIQGTRLPVGSGVAQVASGQFVRANAGNSSNGFAGASLQPRYRSPVGQPGDDGTGSVTELKGLLSGVDWSQASVGFVLRGVTVQADASQIAAVCRSADPGQTLYVTVAGYAPAPNLPLRANAVNCSTDTTSTNGL